MDLWCSAFFILVVMGVFFLCTFAGNGYIDGEEIDSFFNDLLAMGMKNRVSCPFADLYLNLSNVFKPVHFLVRTTIPFTREGLKCECDFQLYCFVFPFNWPWYWFAAASRLFLCGNANGRWNCRNKVCCWFVFHRQNPRNWSAWQMQHLTQSMDHKDLFDNKTEFLQESCKWKIAS